MSQRRRLPNSLRWRAVGWMEMGLSQANAAKDVLNVRPVPGRPRATTFNRRRPFLKLFRHEGEEPLTCRSSLQTTFKHQEEESPLLRCEIVFTKRSVCKKTSCVCSLNGRQRRNRLCRAREHVSWTQQQWASVLFTDESRFTMESDSGRLLIWREQRISDTINPTLLKDTVIEVVESWFSRDLARWPH
ncbi:uncharacterized protein TNCV_2704471 [Trichonephila clavipes]|nr:uncharacterized protein TNCV_2704471 [Trichonephila clavipes]